MPDRKSVSANEGFNGTVCSNKNTATGKNRCMIAAYQARYIVWATARVDDLPGVTSEAVKTVVTLGAHAPDDCMNYPPLNCKNSCRGGFAVHRYQRSTMVCGPASGFLPARNFGIVHA